MKKQFLSPAIEVMLLEENDICTLSAGVGTASDGMSFDMTDYIFE